MLQHANDLNVISEASLTELVVTAALPRPAGSPLVDDWACLRVSICLILFALDCSNLL